MRQLSPRFSASQRANGATQLPSRHSKHHGVLTFEFQVPGNVSFQTCLPSASALTYPSPNRFPSPIGASGDYADEFDIIAHGHVGTTNNHHVRVEHEHLQRQPSRPLPSRPSRTLPSRRRLHRRHIVWVFTRAEGLRSTDIMHVARVPQLQKGIFLARPHVLVLVGVLVKIAES